jgi:hypothetical protein
MSSNEVASSRRSQRRVLVFVLNGDPAAAGEGASLRHEEVARRSLEYAAATLRSFEEHHTRFAASLTAYLVEVVRGGPSPLELADRLKRRFVHGCETVAVHHAMLEPFVDAGAPDRVRAFLLAFAIRRTPDSLAALLGDGVVFVRDGAVTQAFDALEAAGKTAAAFLVPPPPGAGDRDLLHPGALFVDTARLGAGEWLSPFLSLAAVHHEVRVGEPAPGAAPAPSATSAARVNRARTDESAAPDPRPAETQAKRTFAARSRADRFAVALADRLRDGGAPSGLLVLNELYGRTATAPTGVVASDGIVVCPFFEPGAEQALEGLAPETKLGSWAARAVRTYRGA